MCRAWVRQFHKRVAAAPTGPGQIDPGLARAGTVDFFGQPVGSDFTAFWNAGLIANQGHPTQAWNLDLLNAGVRATHQAHTLHSD